jgi:hypothetical protein
MCGRPEGRGVLRGESDHPCRTVQAAHQRPGQDFGFDRSYDKGRLSRAIHDGCEHRGSDTSLEPEHKTQGRCRHARIAAGQECIGSPVRKGLGGPALGKVWMHANRPTQICIGRFG